MINRNVPSLAILSAFLLITAPALAALPNAHSAAAARDLGAKHAAGQTELKAFQQIKISIDDAIATAESARGGIVIDARFEISKGKPVYRVKTCRDYSVWEGTIDAQTGELIGKGKTTPEARLDQEKKAELVGLSQAYTTLPEAMAMAEDRDAGRAISAGLEEMQGKIVFEVTVVKNASVKKIMIDPQSGQVVS